MTGWWRKACDRATNLGINIAEMTRRVHGEARNRRMVKLALELEETLQLDDAIELGSVPVQPGQMWRMKPEQPR